MASVASKVALGSADAGFVYVTDGLAREDRAKRSPAEWAQPPVRYQICAVRRAGADTARRDGLHRQVTGKAGRGVLKRYGFGLPPRELVPRGAFTALLALSRGSCSRSWRCRSWRCSPRCRCATCPELLGEPVVRDALEVTLRTNLVANALILGFGTPAACCSPRAASAGARWWSRWSSCRSCCRRRWPGIGLLAAFGPGGLLGDELRDAGIVLPFTEWAVVLAVTFVASPFYVRQAIARSRASTRR